MANLSEIFTDIGEPNENEIRRWIYFKFCWAKQSWPLNQIEIIWEMQKYIYNLGENLQTLGRAGRTKYHSIWLGQVSRWEECIPNPGVFFGAELNQTTAYKQRFEIVGSVDVGNALQNSAIYNFAETVRYRLQILDTTSHRYKGSSLKNIKIRTGVWDLMKILQGKNIWKGDSLHCLLWLSHACTTWHPCWPAHTVIHTCHSSKSLKIMNDLKRS